MPGPKFPEKKALYFNWLEMNKAERQSKGLDFGRKDLAVQYNLAATTLVKWEKEYYGGMRAKEALAEDLVVIRKDAELKAKAQIEAETPPKTEEEEWEDFKEHLRKQAMKPNASAPVMTLYANLEGKLIDKKEIKIGLSADDIARRNLIADRELKQ